MRLLAEPVKSARKIRQEARLKAQAERLEKKLGLTPLTPAKVKSETPNKGCKSKSLLMCFNKKLIEVGKLLFFFLLILYMYILLSKQTHRPITALTNYHPDLPALEGTYQRGINPALIARAPAAIPLRVQGSPHRGRSSPPTITACLASSLDRMV